MKQQSRQFPSAGNDGSIQHEKANDNFELLIH